MVVSEEGTAVPLPQTFQIAKCASLTTTELSLSPAVSFCRQSGDLARLTYIESLWMDLNITHYSTTLSFLLLLPSLYLFTTSPHGERSISNGNDYSHYENPAKGLDQSITLPSF